MKMNSSTGSWPCRNSCLAVNYALCIMNYALVCFHAKVWKASDVSWVHSPRCSDTTAPAPWRASDSARPPLLYNTHPPRCSPRRTAAPARRRSAAPRRTDTPSPPPSKIPSPAHGIPTAPRPPDPCRTSPTRCRASPPPPGCSTIVFSKKGNINL